MIMAQRASGTAVVEDFGTKCHSGSPIGVIQSPSAGIRSRTIKRGGRRPERILSLYLLISVIQAPTGDMYHLRTK
jgi:hypothetical protein